MLAAISTNGCEASVGLGAVGVTLIVTVASGRSGTAGSNAFPSGTMSLDVGATASDGLAVADVGVGVDDAGGVISSDAGGAGVSHFD